MIHPDLTMPTDPDALELQDLANAAAIAADAAGSAPPVTRTVDTAYGLATVHRDDAGADVVLHDQGVTVHVRGDVDTCANHKNEN